MSEVSAESIIEVVLLELPKEAFAGRKADATLVQLKTDRRECESLSVDEWLELIEEYKSHRQQMKAANRTRELGLLHQYIDQLYTAMVRRDPEKLRRFLLFKRGDLERIVDKESKENRILAFAWMALAGLYVRYNILRDERKSVRAEVLEQVADATLKYLQGTFGIVYSLLLGLDEDELAKRVPKRRTRCLLRKLHNSEVKVDEDKWFNAHRVESYWEFGCEKYLGLECRRTIPPGRYGLRVLPSKHKYSLQTRHRAYSDGEPRGPELTPEEMAPEPYAWESIGTPFIDVLVRHFEKDLDARGKQTTVEDFYFDLQYHLFKKATNDEQRTILWSAYFVTKGDCWLPESIKEEMLDKFTGFMHSVQNGLSRARALYRGDTMDTASPHLVYPSKSLVLFLKGEFEKGKIYRCFPFRCAKCAHEINPADPGIANCPECGYSVSYQD